MNQHIIDKNGGNCRAKTFRVEEERRFIRRLEHKTHNRELCTQELIVHISSSLFALALLLERKTFLIMSYCTLSSLPTRDIQAPPQENQANRGETGEIEF